MSDAYAEGAGQGDHELTMIEIAGLPGDPVLRDRHAYQSGDLPAPLRPAQEAIGRADHLV